jgi:hypothetical protein
MDENGTGFRYGGILGIFLLPLLVALLVLCCNHMDLKHFHILATV